MSRLRRKVCAGSVRCSVSSRRIEAGPSPVRNGRKSCMLEGTQDSIWETGMAEVRVQEGESLENALRRFKRKVQTEDIIKEVKRHSYYLKPGEKLRVKQALARKRARKKIRKEQDFKN
jgi:small subunit ribosomal protein S21